MQPESTIAFHKAMSSYRLFPLDEWSFPFITNEIPICSLYFSTHGSLLWSECSFVTSTLVCGNPIAQCGIRRWDLWVTFGDMTVGLS